MTRRHRRTLARLAAALFALTACTPSTTASIIPTPVATTATPTPSPTPTYGPNQTAAIAVVTGYYAWWNAARKNPRGPLDPKFGDLARYVPSAAIQKITPMPYADVSDLGSYGYRQVGDMVITQLVPTADNASKIPVPLCLDRTATSVVDAAGTTVDAPWDARAGKNVPAAELFTRSAYFAVVTHFPDSGWLITEITGGATSC